MTYLEAAYAILKQSGKPLHYKEITRRALAQGLIEPRGLTPEATMGSRLYTDTVQAGYSVSYPLLMKRKDERETRPRIWRTPHPPDADG